ncbi:MAG: flagellar biosynthesis protein FlgM [Oscillatoriales cyanobacterium RM1_1_9]|nr:flagellar biosynthesis protein FlgM [Oscillatoriales cyanobacterium SM2_3_0]NJO45867.1 flagellar biosynthesis protein FlgM [Oscillatoriales cyanobacterium RM2_1_1]NJO71304.1 flagellar biosynthesis protein FlgM [Oscillatoriales cyanobacterium RM1_1_9]
MRWQMGRRSQNVEDRRGAGAPVAVGGGIGVVVLALIAALLGFDPTPILNQAVSTDPGSNSGQTISPEDEQLADFVAVVLGDTEDTWNSIFQQIGADYREPTLVMFSGRVDSACGLATAASGPFYCPQDQKVYIDLSFYNDMKYKLNAPGDFAQAYVIAHEIGHHVQTLLGISQQVTKLQRQASKIEANQLSVMLELQADCLAGVWAHHADDARQILEQGDVEEAMNAASQIGDDRLQRQAQGYVVPDSFTHGSSAQRVRWFKQGLQSGDLNQCNTFEAKNL